MLLYDFIAAMEKLAPIEYKLDFDNVGLLVGTAKTDIRRVLVALDCSISVALEAVSMKADLVLTHHPILMNGVKRLLPDSPDTAAAYILITNGIAMYAAHTNLDAAPGGVNDCLSNALSLKRALPLPPVGLGRIGELDENEAMRFVDFARYVQSRLGGPALRCGDDTALIRRVAVLGGSGGDALAAAKEAGADAYVTGELKHHQALEAGVIGLNVIAAGHYETERVVLEPLITRLQSLTDGIQYKLALYDQAPFKGI